MGLASSLVYSAEKPLDWYGGQQSAASRFRAQTGVTQPLLYAVPVWSRSQVADLDLITKNSAALASLHESRSRWVPIAFQGNVQGSAYDVADVFKGPGPRQSQIVNELLEDGERLQRVQAEIHSYYIMKNFAYSFHYHQQRNLWIEGNPKSLRYQAYRDFLLQLSSGGKVFEDKGWGSLDMGASLRAHWRLGGNYTNEISAANESIEYKSKDFKRRAGLPGFDVSMLWSSPNFSANSWGFQLGFSGKNLLATRFLTRKYAFGLIGKDPETTHDYPTLARDLTLGVALKLPNFGDSIRSAFRVEWNQWGRDVGSSQKLGISYEMRFPVLASVYTGLRGGALAAGVGLRFKGLELDLGTFSEDWGQGANHQNSRGWSMELRSAF